MAKLFDDKPIVAPTLSAEVSDPTKPPIPPQKDLSSPEEDEPPVDLAFWERALADAERAEKDWRARGREIIRIYRNDGGINSNNKRSTNKDVVFNILFSNTEVMLPNIYSTPPAPVVRSRFVKKSEPTPLPAPPPAMPPPQDPNAMAAGADPNAVAAPPPPPPSAGGGAAPQMVNGAEGPGILQPSGAPPGGPPPGAGGPPPQIVNGPEGPGILQSSAGGPPPAGAAPPMGIPTSPPSMGGPPPPPQPPGMMAPMQPALPPPGMPTQRDMDTAAAVMEKALEIIVDDNESHEAIKSAVKDMLLPGRGTCRVRWNPQMEPAAPELADPNRDPSLPPEMVKVWESVQDEYVYWEDILMDPVRQFGDTQWVAFRHLFTESQLLQEFSDNEQIQKLKAKGKLSEILKWTEESAAKDTVGGGGAMKTSDKLGDVIKKAMVWEIWDRNDRRIIWFIRELSGIALRTDPDALGLSGFFPIPRPLLAVTTTDSLLPRPYYDLYRHLAADLDETSRRISKLTEKIKVRGGYNAANRDIAQLLLADDGKMIPVDGVDLINGGLDNHIWLVPIVEWMQALKELYLAREQVKGAIYEVMGISDIMRGNTNPYETATAQRIKGTMGTNRLDGQKMVCANFALDLLRMKAEIIAKNFDANTLMRMTGEEVTPPVEAILRDDFQRTCSIDIETDSTVAIDESAEQESNANMMMAMQGVLQGAQGMMMTGVLPPPMVMQFTLEMIKMMVHPMRGSRGVVELIDDFQEQISAAAMMNPNMMAPPAVAPPGADPATGQAPPQQGQAPPPEQAAPPGVPLQ